MAKIKQLRHAPARILAFAAGHALSSDSASCFWACLAVIVGVVGYLKIQSDQQLQIAKRGDDEGSAANGFDRQDRPCSPGSRP